MDSKKILEWIATHPVGISSRTMWTGVMEAGSSEKRNFQFDLPYDPDDFARCADLYEFAELNEEDFAKIKKHFPFYTPLLDKWDELYGLYKANKNSQLYEKLSTIVHGR